MGLTALVTCNVVILILITNFTRINSDQFAKKAHWSLLQYDTKSVNDTYKSRAKCASGGKFPVCTNKNSSVMHYHHC